MLDRRHSGQQRLRVRVPRGKKQTVRVGNLEIPTSASVSRGRMLNTYIFLIRNNGELQRLHRKWLGEDMGELQPM